MAAGSTHEPVLLLRAEVGGNATSPALALLEDDLLEQAKSLCCAKRWDEAMTTFVHALAVCEKLNDERERSVRAAILHNIGYCLHNMCKWDAAKAYYEGAPLVMLSLDHAQPPRHPRPMDGHPLAH